MKITALLLAAGQSKRFGIQNKLTAHIENQPLIRHSLRAIDRPEIDDIVVIVSSGSEGQRIREALGYGRWRYATVDGDPPEISRSIKTGISMVPTMSSGVLIALADMPGIPSSFISALCESFINAGGERIVCPKRKDSRLGHPVIWPKRFMPALKTLRGDRGARPLLTASEIFIEPFLTEHPSMYIDIDTPADIQAYTRLTSNTGD